MSSSAVATRTMSAVTVTSMMASRMMLMMSVTVSSTAFASVSVRGTPAGSEAVAVGTTAVG